MDPERKKRLLPLPEKLCNWRINIPTHMPSKQNYHVLLSMNGRDKLHGVKNSVFTIAKSEMKQTLHFRHKKM